MGNQEISSLPKAYGIKEGAEKFPLMVIASVSYICNARCPACPYTQSTIRKDFADTPFMPVKVFKKIAREAGQFGSMLRITGGGEPLLHPQMIELIEYAKRVGAKVGLITNGSLLTPKKVDRLLATGTDAIDISVDAADAGTYSKVRVGLNFNVLLENVNHLVSRRNAARSKTKVIVSIINQKAIEGKLDEAVGFWKSVADNVQVRKYMTWGIGNPTESGDTTPLTTKREPCPWIFERIDVDGRGKIVLCGSDIKGETDFGNVQNTSIESVWRGEELEALRKRMLEDKLDAKEICSTCPDWQYRSWDYNYWKVLKDADRVR